MYPLEVHIDPAETQYINKGETIEFSATAIGGCPNYTYSWNFGGGTSSDGTTSQSPSVTFPESLWGQEVTVSVEITDDEGTTDSDSVTVVVPKVTLDFPNTICDGATAEVTMAVEPSSASIEDSSLSIERADSASTAGSNPIGELSVIEKDGGDNTKWKIR